MTRKSILCLLIFLFSAFHSFAAEVKEYLIPAPQEMELVKEASGVLKYSDILPAQIATALINRNNQYLEGTITIPQESGDIVVSFELKPEGMKPQGYIMSVTKSAVKIYGQNKAALFYAKQTLLQLVEYAKAENKTLPLVYIEDWPDFERRGYMLDISRDKVPTMETLYRIIDFLSQWKINEVQLYTEHTFAYSRHKVVWENASPITAEEARLLDAYCKRRFIDLVPNQNSFGHMENWLKHEEYLHLAECPDDCETAWGKRKRHSLNPIDPGSIELMQGLYAELLPNFSSEYVNIGGDETIELGHGRSEKVVKKKGKGVVYLEYLKKLNKAVNEQGKKAQFWGDIIVKHPELIPDIPENMTALVWGYESNFPFDEKLPKFKAAGLDFYVCPGTSTWRSEIGRDKDAFANLKNAALNGKKFGAKGFLNTNWGDYGHWQPLSVCYPPMMLGASYAWHYDEDSEKNLALQLNQYVFEDPTGKTAEAVLKLGNAYLKTNLPEGNSNAFHLMLRRYKWTMQGHFQTRELTTSGLNSAEKEIKEALEILQEGKPQAPDWAITQQELRQAAQLAMHGIHLGLARLQAPEQATANIPKEKKQELAKELAPLIENHKQLWLIRNRPGGLQDSAEKLEGLLEYYEQ